MNDEPFPGSPDDMMNQIAALRAENAQLKEALQPFVEYANDCDKANLPDTARIAYSPERITHALNVGDLRRARAALSDETSADLLPVRKK